MGGRCTIQSDREGERTVLRVSGTFDRTSAHELTERLADVAATELVVDFSLVHEFADLGVATLAHDLAGVDRRLLLRGLRPPQLRIFRYFGLDVEANPSSGDTDPLEVFAPPP
jgi:anti-anti-sigma regulatory factor